MFNAEFYDLLMDVSGAIYGALAAVRAHRADPAPAPPPLLQVQAGRAESPGWFLVQAGEFDPEPLTVANLRVRDIYASERRVAALLDLMAGERWLTRNAHDAYALDDAGRALLQRLRERPRALLADLQPLPPADLARLESLLGRLVAASRRSPTPPGAWCLAHSRRRAPAPGDPPLLQIRQYFDDFNAFRDDAHMAAWQPHESRGYAWEAFALVCSGAAADAEAVFTQLVHRGYAAWEYAAALDDLVARGWLTRTPEGAYEVTDPGRTLRTQVEHNTDHYFYTPWQTLTEDEIAEVRSLLPALQAGLQAIT